MKLRSLVESEYGRQAEALASCSLFQALEQGRAVPEDYDLFIRGICRSHLKSPHILAFLFALAPPDESEKLKRNMLEEMGLDEVGVSHPALLLRLMKAAGFDEKRRAQVEREAAEELRSIISQPMLFGTLKELGLSVLMETVAFEWMLSHMASRMACALSDYRRMPRHSLEWFYHHSEVDLRHREEGLGAVAAYAHLYEIPAEDAATILEITFRENVFIKRYFGARVIQDEGV
ncbi:MAG: iron-containing redox enzyme family protein [Pyrinomonadaceae bacterium]|nr:iron-containing redox enzyme family protein [Pyrinomonadaceae bacterium]